MRTANVSILIISAYCHLEYRLWVDDVDVFMNISGQVEKRNLRFVWTDLIDSSVFLLPVVNEKKFELPAWPMSVVCLYSQDTYTPRHTDKNSKQMRAMRWVWGQEKENVLEFVHHFECAESLLSIVLFLIDFVSFQIFNWFNRRNTIVDHQQRNLWVKFDWTNADRFSLLIIENSCSSEVRRAFHSA